MSAPTDHAAAVALAETHFASRGPGFAGEVVAFLEDAGLLTYAALGATAAAAPAKQAQEPAPAA